MVQNGIAQSHGDAVRIQRIGFVGAFHLDFEGLPSLQIQKLAGVCFQSFDVLFAFGDEGDLLDAGYVLEAFGDGFHLLVAKINVNVVVIPFADDLKRLEGHPDVMEKSLDELLAVVAFGGQFAVMDHEIIVFHKGLTSESICLRLARNAATSPSVESGEKETRIELAASLWVLPMDKRTSETGSFFEEQAETEET